jgi:hypothetical protein
VDQDKRTKYEEGDFQSVAFDQAVKRLENICDQAINLPGCGATSRAVEDGGGKNEMTARGLLGP